MYLNLIPIAAILLSSPSGMVVHTPVNPQIQKLKPKQNKS